MNPMLFPHGTHLCDLQVSQMVIAYADYKMRTEDPRFPVGQARLEAIGVLACECVQDTSCTAMHAAQHVLRLMHGDFACTAMPLSQSTKRRVAVEHTEPEARVTQP